MKQKINYYTSRGVAAGLLLLLPCMNAFAQSKKKIEIRNAEVAKYNEYLFPGAERLIGNVIVQHEGVTMTCDSAHLYSAENKLEAFGNVLAEQGDTLFMWGDRLDYDANIEFAKVRGNVKLKDPEITLTTDALDYNMVLNIGYYNTGGTIVDSSNVLVSRVGRYYADLDQFFFRDDVVVTSDNFTLESDTLKYFSVSEIVEIVGPTDIVGTDGVLYSEGGWFDTRNDIGHLTKNSKFVNGTEEQELFGDTIHYEKATGLGEAFSNVILNDIKNDVFIYGNKGSYNEITEFSMVTDSAILVQCGKRDTLYMHADTLRSNPDSIGSEHRIFYGNYQVRFFKPDIQGRCDSLVYTMRDSIIEMNLDPILWTPGNQMRAKQIIVLDKPKDPDLVKMYDNSFVIMEEGPLQFNQIKGRDMTGFIRNSEVYQIDVDGNGETIYYAKEKQDVMGINLGTASSITIRIKEQKINTITFKDSPNMSLNPQDWLNPSDKELKDFEWRDDIRPKDKNDIFPIVPVEEEETIEGKVSTSVIGLLKEALMNPEELEARIREAQKMPADSLESLQDSVDPKQLYEVMNSPILRQLLKSPQAQAITSSLDVTDFVKKQVMKLLQDPASLQQLLKSDQVQELMKNDQVQDLMKSDQIKDIMKDGDPTKILESKEIQDVIKGEKSEGVKEIIESKEIKSTKKIIEE